MLLEIKSDVFRNRKISFHPGLNIVLGDRVATNSIGKTTLLLIIDFAFGGSSYIDLCTDAISELGQHEFHFTFIFDGARYEFKRGTLSPDLIEMVNHNESIKRYTLKDYCSFLAISYHTDNLNASFREIVSLYSRIWRKENDDPLRPLNLFKSQPAKDSIDMIIKIFGEYNNIEEASKALYASSEERKTLNGAFNKKIIPKINASQYKTNKLSISSISNEVDEIKDNLERIAINISEIINRETLELKAEKDRLLAEKLKLEGSLQRVQKNLSQTKYIKSSHFDGLRKFFPEINMEKIASIEEFHSSIAKIMKNELTSSEKVLIAALLQINLQIKTVDEKISSFFTGRTDNTKIIIDRILSLSQNLSKLSSENLYFEKSQILAEEVKGKTKSFLELRNNILGRIALLINDNIRDCTNRVYGSEWKSPKLNFTDTNYEFEVIADTGTGKSYSNLILFDLAVSRLTLLPILIHDSILFKNLGTEIVRKLVVEYALFSKQAFIALDEVKKYGDLTNYIVSQSVVRLSDKRVLFIKDWRQTKVNAS